MLQAHQKTQIDQTQTHDLKRQSTQAEETRQTQVCGGHLHSYVTIRVQEDVCVLSLKTGSMIMIDLPSFFKYPDSLINLPISSISSAYLPKMFAFILLSICKVV